MSPWLVVFLIAVTAWIAAGILLCWKGNKRSGDDEISDFIRTNHGRKLKAWHRDAKRIPPRSPSRKKRGF